LDFAAQAREKESVSMDPKTGNRAFLLVGDEDWPFPVPIVKLGDKWSFDSKAGRQELLYRRIGSNELDAIDVCRGYVEAQYEYALKKREVYEVNQYAQRIISTPGKQDGLAWQDPDGSWGGPVGEKNSSRSRARLHNWCGAIPWIFLQDFERAGACGTTRRNGLRHKRRDDRRIRVGRCTGRVWGDWSKDIHRQPGWCCLREGFWIG